MLTRKYSIIAIIAAGLTASAFMFNPVPNSMAPGFKLESASGKTISLENYKGKYVVLEWWNYGCPVVVKHYKSGNIPALQKELMGQDVVWLSVVSSAPGKQGYVTKDDADEQMKKLGGKATEILFDASGVTGKAYKATATPQLVLISPKGEMLYNGAIDNNPRASGEEILKSENYLRKAWNEVKAGKPVSTPSTVAYGCNVKY